MMSRGGGSEEPNDTKPLFCCRGEPGCAAQQDCSLLAAGIYLDSERTQQNDRGFVALGGDKSSIKAQTGGGGCKGRPQKKSRLVKDQAALSPSTDTPEGAAPEGAERAPEHQHTTDGAGSQGPPGKFPAIGQSRPCAWAQQRWAPAGAQQSQSPRKPKQHAGWAALTGRL